MHDEFETQAMLGKLFETVGLELSDDDLDTISQLHKSFAGQRSRLAAAARSETEPMIVPAFDRAQHETEPADERTA